MSDESYEKIMDMMRGAREEGFEHFTNREECENAFQSLRMGACVCACEYVDNICYLPLV